MTRIAVNIFTDHEADGRAFLAPLMASAELRPIRIGAFEPLREDVTSDSFDHLATKWPFMFRTRGRGYGRVDPLGPPPSLSRGHVSSGAKGDPGAVDLFKQLPLERANVVGDAYVKFLATELKPLIDAKYRTLKDRKDTMLMGSSMGGLISAYALVRYPDVFGAAALSKTRLVADGGRALAGFGGAMIGRCSYVGVRRKRKT